MGAEVDGDVPARKAAGPTAVGGAGAGAGVGVAEAGEAAVGAVSTLGTDG